MLLLIIIAGTIMVALYNRYFPVRGVQCSTEIPTETESILILDVRDYNQSSANPIPHAVNLPVAYINRNWDDVAATRIHVAASTPLEKNMSIRMLKRKGYKVAGYTLTEKQSPPKQNKGKGYCYGI
ncbi:hypothetical protein FZC79_11620 [Rossellomorea vietnamensis]|uniref:Rhodanese domain-containing protein n=2 Tax=Rossellomorea TaxID=2837508 RepID=A0A5D4KE30_9BACI|nr:MULTISPECIES: hypothetical protein [Rossellomorea]TYR75060.1 hypothetical protein FZC79_11620 [Rossellomorea vietnamensis]TYS79816.1 hypothetical protein FZC80_09270 [Rossellomorea aquimaris]